MSSAAISETINRQPPRASRLWAVWILPCLAVAGYAIVQYLIVPPSHGHFSQHPLLLGIHAAGGALALLTGPWQFSTKLRIQRIQWHRWLGRIFLLSVAASSVAGLALSFQSEEGWATHAGFGLLAIVWFWTALSGYNTVRAKRFFIHREWLIRCFALALAAVTLRIELPLLLILAHASFHVAYITVSWVCWIPNLIVAEWWIQTSRRHPTGFNYLRTVKLSNAHTKHLNSPQDTK